MEFATTNTETAKKALLKYATALREDFLDNQERDNAWTKK